MRITEFHTNGISPTVAGGSISMAEKTLMSKEGRKIPALISFAFLRGEGARGGEGLRSKRHNRAQDS